MKNGNGGSGGAKKARAFSGGTDRKAPRGPTRAVIYAYAASWRPPHDPLVEQVAECEAFAVRNRLKVVATFEDLGASRPGLNAVGVAIASRQADVVIVRDLERLSRDPRIVGIICAHAASAGVKIVTTTGLGVRPRSPLQVGE